MDLTDNNYKVVYFDLESSGFGRNADILELAAQNEDRIFSIYIKPTKPIAVQASEINGLTYRNGELLFRNKKVDTVPLKNALRKFLAFLRSSKPALLVAHNAKFDTMLLVQAFQKTATMNKFQSVIAGFSDSLTSLKKKFPDRKGKGQFTLSVLTRDLLKIENTGQFHNASYDVQVLKELATKFLSTSDLIRDSKSFKEAFLSEMRAQDTSIYVQSLAPLRDTISIGMMKKIAEARISYSTLTEVFQQKSSEGLKELLSEKQSNNKPRVTKTDKILNDIVNFFENNGAINEEQDPFYNKDDPFYNETGPFYEDLDPFYNENDSFS